MLKHSGCVTPGTTLVTYEKNGKVPQQKNTTTKYHNKKVLKNKIRQIFLQDVLLNSLFTLGVSYESK